MENPDALDEKVSEAKSLPKSSELFETCLMVGPAYTGTYLAAIMGLDHSFECSDLCHMYIHHQICLNELINMMYFIYDFIAYFSRN